MPIRNLDGGAAAFLPLLPLIIIPLILWSLFWKGLALWHSAQRRDVIWFILMLFINSLGILEIIYLFSVAKLKADQLFKK